MHPNYRTKERVRQDTPRITQQGDGQEDRQAVSRAADKIGAPRSRG